MPKVKLNEERRIIEAFGEFDLSMLPLGYSVIEVDEVPEFGSLDDYVVDVHGNVEYVPMEREEEAEPLPTYAELLDAVNMLGDAVAELMDSKEGA